MSESIEIIIRPIQAGDNKILAGIIRDTLQEFGANRPGTVFFDPTTDQLYELFQTLRSNYLVALINNQLVGGAGIYPTDGLDEDTCELVKMYLLPIARGKGIARQLINQNIDFARNNGYKNIYLESMPELKRALTVYEQFGFTYLKAPMGNSGHNGCDLWMLKKL